MNKNKFFTVAIFYIVIINLFIILLVNKSKILIRQEIEASNISITKSKNLNDNVKTALQTPLITIKPKYTNFAQYKSQSKQTNELLKKQIKQKNTTFFITFNQNRIALTRNELASCILTSNKILKSTPINVDCLKQKIKNKIPALEHLVPMYYNKNKYIFIRQEDFVIDYNKLAKQIEYTLNNEKFADYKFIQAPIKYDSPNTDGKLAPIYIETDDSRQLVFLWDHGKYQAFKMSGAYKNFYPLGIHKIFYKAPLAWSSVANVWMPYWMAFTKYPKTGALIGLHGLIYYCPGRKGKYCNKYIYEPETNLGTPKSLGCLRVSVKDAKYIYKKVKVGTYIVVHE